MTPRDVAELVRAPAALTVLGDTLAGAAASDPASPGARAGGRDVARRTMLPAASACLYLGGMALNDWADRDLDAVERPERPVPSGRVSAGQALVVGAGLTAAGVALAGAAGGRRALGVALPLAACVWAYDGVAKDTPAGPVVMAACRGLDVLLGAAPTGLRPALPAAAALAAHTAGVTALSRGEVHGTTTAVAATVAAGTVGVTAYTAGTAVAAARRPLADGPASPSAGRTAAVGAAVAAAAYTAACLPAQVRAARDRSAPAARTATGAGIAAMVPLQAAWALRGGRLGTAVVLGGVAIAGRLLRRRRRAVSVT
ncbi:SCO3242 family prenyltransferase [Isoptericola sp. BMS4]|uniref:SCO3242 family prenyltransferase n=1 Tax=Isoptericola sp. BMS4 TaxID=2527875 RepID=UPI0014206244|nr:UbiA family prenyltransferase [Isoptericola sp. BMS4]